MYRRQQKTHRYDSKGALPIPDDDPFGIHDSIDVDVDGHLRHIHVTVQVWHPAPGDLLIGLRGPSLAHVVLRRQAFTREQELELTFESKTHPGLRTLIDQSPLGRWTLTIKDLVARDVGHLRSWTLTIEVLSRR